MGGHCHSRQPIYSPFSVFWLNEEGSFLRFSVIFDPVLWLLNAAMSSFIPSGKTALRLNVSTFMLDYGKCFLQVIVSISFPPNTVGQVDSRDLFGLAQGREDVIKKEIDILHKV
ncbi:hypothetical protein ILYODFUR_023661 [Ilyodon furcidens]|uniref:Uncharacterized protein n=1 Tax=Ilyodon furcidens TaxID=33524 RepID=A0ABV0VHK4_9TELE